MRDKLVYEEGFLIILLLLAIVGLVWLFQPFLEALFFAMILATASYPYYQKILVKVKGAQTTASGIMSGIVFAVVLVPVSYLLVEMSLQFGHLYGQAQTWLAKQDSQSLIALNQSFLSYLPLSEAAQANAIEQLKENSEKILSFVQKVALVLLQGVLGTTSSFLTFLGLSMFALFFFYRDGHAIARHLKLLSPLENRFDKMIMDRFASLSNVLTLSVLGIAVLQGVSFAVISWILGLPGLFIGMAVAVTSFIPIVGAALVWIPMVVYLFFEGNVASAALIVFWGIFITGFLIDNIARPMLIRRLSQSLGTAGQDLTVANHTLITVLSTFAGLIHFGVIGLFFGPVLAAMAITIFDVYEEMHRERLDCS